jgi:CHAT domain-containing protein
MNREFGTQMESIGLFIDPRNDKVMTSTKYFDADEWEGKLLSVILYLQKMMRGFFARKTKRLYKEQERKKQEEKESVEEEERRKEEIRNKREIERRMHPKSNQDFSLLKKELEMWVKNETIRIKSSNLNEEDKTLALQELLHKEISLLQTIEKLKISANKENKTEKISNFLEKMSADKEWVRHDGHPIFVETPLTKTAEKLEEQFKNLNLLEFKKLMEGYYQENKCVLIQEIISLIERESDMLQRGRPESSLEGKF